MNSTTWGSGTPRSTGCSRRAAAPSTWRSGRRRTSGSRRSWRRSSPTSSSIPRKRFPSSTSGSGGSSRLRRGSRTTTSSGTYRRPSRSTPLSRKRGAMLRYVLRRLLLTIPLLVGISLLSFLAVHMAPGGPISVAADLNPKATAEYRERMTRYYGLDQPLHVQYGRWLVRMATLDFGRSFAPDGREV